MLVSNCVVCDKKNQSSLKIEKVADYNSIK